jgi:release factor glutamine methyltransferase
MRCVSLHARKTAMVESLQTIGEVLHAGAVALGQAGIAEPRREALRVWRDLERRRAADLPTHPDERADADRAGRFGDAVRRRAAGEPLAHVTGWTGFRRLTLRCDARALIPRPETEGLVEAALARVRTGVAADIGTGTGAIALALSDEGSFDTVFGLDASLGALALASENAAATGLAVTLSLGDLVAPLAGRQVNLLVSNPPYLTRAEYDSLDRAVRDYEPELALVAGEDGLLLTRRLFDEGRAVVAPVGWIAVEVDCRRAAETARMASALAWQEVTVLDDLFGRARYVLARRGSTP